MIYKAPKLTAQEEDAVRALDELRTSLRMYTASPRRWLGGLRRLTFAKAVQGSNSIEGYDANIDDVLEVVGDEQPIDAATETAMALQGYRDAMTYVLNLATEDVRVDTSLIKALHFMMLKYDLSKRPGRWRAGFIYVQREPDRETVYEGPDVETVEPLMSELTSALAVEDGPVLIRAAMAHLNLVMIHPFADGNGRMGRCLQTLVLTHDRILDPVFCSIEENLGRNTPAYYEVLGRVGQGSWHPTNDARPWVRFCLNAHYQQARTLQWRIHATEAIWGLCEQVVIDRSLPWRTVGPIAMAAQGHRLRNSSYRSAVKDTEGEEISEQTASGDLRRLVEAKLLAPVGQTRGRIYVPTPILNQLWANVRRTRPKPEQLDLFVQPPEQLTLMPAG
ncbi:MAG: Fic family protein [Actinomycetota bacterium]|jgi:Fic family protein|nr:MAG: hypothetical protein FD127_1936 [Acidimicrobiaceae bacterium]